jgi:hypothetical protein
MRVTGRRRWLTWLAFELAFTTVGAFMAVVGVSILSGTGGLVDDPNPPPVSAEIAAMAAPLQRAAFIKTFALLAAPIACLHFADYVASLFKREEEGHSPGPSVQIRRHFLIVLLLVAFIFGWVQAWLTTLFDAAPGSIEPLLAWIVVAGALWALVIARFARPAWPSHGAVGLVVVVTAAAAVSILHRRIQLTLLATIPALGWLLFDKRLADNAVSTNLVSTELAEATRRVEAKRHDG